MFQIPDRSDQSANRTRAPLPGPTNGESPAAAVRSAVHLLHSESEGRGARRWIALWSRRAPTRSAIARLGLDGDLGKANLDLLERTVAQLRLATTQYVVGLREEGAPPEEMLVRVKGLMSSALVDEGWWDREAARSLTSAMVVWSIDAYYGQ